jgi:alpha-N-arabinofuranosidase
MLFVKLFRRLLVPVGFTLCFTGVATAQLPLVIYDDGLQGGFQNWSWAANNFNNPAPVRSGIRSISASASAWQGISFYHAGLDTANFTHFSFWAHGGTSGGQRLQVYAEYPGGGGPTQVLPGSLPANTWQQYSIPLPALGVANRTDLNRLTLQLRADGTTGTFYLDDIELQPAPLPDVVNISVNATQMVRLVDERHFGVNLTMWDKFMDPPHHTTTASLLQEMGTTVVRMPGGSLSDQYYWYSNTTLTNTWPWDASFADMARVTTNAGAQAFVVVNYGSGTPAEAAAWVRHANITNQLGFKYWEIGNEIYGTWEYDTNSLPHHAYTYAVRATNFIAQMKAADPTIKIGVVAVPGESSYHNGYTDHPAYNPRTGQTNYGWTPVLLQTLKQLGVTPDYLIHHHYPQWTNPDNPASSPNNDVALLQSTGNWANDAADLRQQITDYFGPGGENIELVVTENNADAGVQGRMSTSLVNGLYYADSLGRLLQTEFNAFVWWDLRNGTDRSGSFATHLYGWRDYGDLGMINGPSTRHPPFYAAKLMQWFARPGDKILAAATDYSWLAAYAARRANGAVSLLVLNKSSSASLNAQISVAGYVPQAAATVRSFGIPNDEATRTNGPAVSQDLTTAQVANAGAEFNYTFAPYSLTLFTLVPTAPQLTGLAAAPGELAFQIQGQADVRYEIQSSTNLTDWASQSTHTLTTSTLGVTNVLAPGTPQKYWRAVWVP